MDTTKTELDIVKQDLAALRADMGRLVASLGRDLSREAQARLAEPVERVSRFAETAGAKAGQLAREMEERPALTAAVAFGAGFAMALLLTRRRD